MKKIVFFTSSQISLNLIIFLIETKRLAAVVVTPNNNPQFIQMIKYIQENGIIVYQYPTEIKEDFLEILKNLDCPSALSFSFSKIFSNEVISIFKYGIFNIHPSALPKYKGADPLYWQIKKGEKNSAITIHEVTENIDSGDIFYSLNFEIKEEETIASLANNVAFLVPKAIEDFLDKLDKNNFQRIKQNKNQVYKKPSNIDFQIDWKEDNSYEISRKAKALNPIYGGVKTKIKDSYINVLQATPLKSETYGVKEGIIVLIDEKDGLIVSTIDGAIKLDVISTLDGIFSGYSFANFTKLFSGDIFK